MPDYCGMSTSTPLFQAELSFRGRQQDSVQEWIRDRRRKRLQRIGDWIVECVLLPVLRIMLAAIEGLGVLKTVPAPVWTIGSALISIVIYSSHLGLKLSSGFITLLMIHEMGHVCAACRYGIKISPPVFVPFLGALINIQGEIRDPWKQAVMGIAGPLFGTAGALACWGVSHATGSVLFAEIAFAAMVMNLFNLTPVGFLDAGHIVALFSKKLWIIGYLIMAVMA